MISVDVILPTIDENENLSVLIPQLLNLKGFRINKIIIVDDSNDHIRENLVELKNQWPENVKVVLREYDIGDLASAIRLGVQLSSAAYVVWMDADLSMPAKLIETLVARVENLDTVVIGSRFVENGGFKGISEHSGRFSFGWIRRVIESQDSVLAVLLSRILNLAIRLIVGGNVRDLTSGFVLCNREIALNLLPQSGYGEYCIEFLSKANNKDIEIIEVGYYCLPRKFGYSKTGNSLIQLIKTGLPYLGIAFKNNRLRYKSNWAPERGNHGR